MVGNSMFAIQINNRLKDIKGCKDNFEGVSIIAIGDQFQLEPVMDGYVFRDLENLYYAVVFTLQCLKLMKSWVKEKASSLLSCLIGYLYKMQRQMNLMKEFTMQQQETNTELKFKKILLELTPLS